MSNTDPSLVDRLETAVTNLPEEEESFGSVVWDTAVNEPAKVAADLGSFAGNIASAATGGFIPSSAGPWLLWGGLAAGALIIFVTLKRATPAIEHAAQKAAML